MVKVLWYYDDKRKNKIRVKIKMGQKLQIDEISQLGEFGFQKMKKNHENLVILGIYSSIFEIKN
jgi:hypothetical protein